MRYNFLLPLIPTVAIFSVLFMHLNDNNLLDRCHAREKGYQQMITELEDAMTTLEKALPR